MLAGCCLLSSGCQREATIPGDSFRLTVERVVTDRNVFVAFLKIRVPHDVNISLDGDLFHSMVTLSASPADAVRDGQVALIASRITRQGDEFAYIQTFTGIKANGGSGFTGGTAVQPVPAVTRLETYFAVSATDGDYKLNKPIEIARLNGKPVMLTVGRPTK